MTLEDYETYTTVDPETDLTITTNKIVYDTVLEGTKVYVYDDKTASHFGDFEHLFGFVPTAFNVAGKRHVQWGLDNQYIGTYAAFLAADTGIAFYNTYGHGWSYFYVKEFVGNGFDGGYMERAVDLPFYCTIDRDDTALTVKVYTDSDRTSLYDTLVLTVPSTAYRYIIAYGSSDISPGLDSNSGEVFDLDLQEAAPPPAVPRPTVAVGNPLIF